MDDLAGNRYPGANYLEYSVGSLYRKHVLTSTVVYQLPFGAGRKFNPGNAVVQVDRQQLAGLRHLHRDQWRTSLSHRHLHRAAASSTPPATRT